MSLAAAALRNGAAETRKGAARAIMELEKRILNVATVLSKRRREGESAGERTKNLNQTNDQGRDRATQMNLASRK